MNTKTLYFYKLIIKPLPLFEEPNLSNKDYLTKVFQNINEFNDFKDIIMDIIEFNDKFIFGSIGKLKDLNKMESLKRKRALETKEIIEDNTKIPFYIEYYTYFLIGGTSFEDIVVLKNSKAPSIKKPLKLAIENSLNTVSVDILIKQIEDLSKTLNRMKSLCEINLVASTPEITRKIRPSILGIKALSETDAEKVSITLNYKNTPITAEIKEELLSTDAKNYCKFNIKGCSDTDSELAQTVDFIEKMITKQVSLPIDDDILKNNNEIKMLLLRELSSSIERN